MALPWPDVVDMIAAGRARGDAMNDVASSRVPPGEPKLILPFLAPFYNVVRDLSYPLMRSTLGGLMLYHAITSGKLTGRVTVAAFSAVLARRGMEPSLPLAYLAFFAETVCAVCLIVGFMTRFVAAAIAIELAVITFGVYWAQGFHFAQTPGGGAEFPFLFGLMVFFVALRGGGPYSLDRKIGWEL
jgi:putative oxidoreductase